jgi:cobalt-zinc-cadmium efflux system outer membrane protein
MRFASITSILALSLAALPAVAQDAIDENVAIERALAREGIAARDEADRAAAAAEAEIIGPLENPSAEVSYEGGGGTEWQLGVVQPIDLTGRRGALRDAASAEAAAVDADIDRRRQVLVADVRMAFVQCVAATAELDIWQRYADELTEAERVATARAEAGDTAVYDVRRVRVALRSAEAQLARAVGERSAGCAALSSLTGIAEPSVELSSLARLTNAPMRAERPDLVALEQRVLAASQRVTAARRGRFPQFAIGAGVRRVDDGLNVDYGPTASIGISLPIWNGGGAAVRREEALLASRENELLIAQRNVEAEVTAASARMTATREAAVTAAAARDDASRLGTIAETAYQAGEIGVVELLDAYEAARDADLSVIAFALEAALAAIQYDLTTGRTY